MDKININNGGLETRAVKNYISDQLYMVQIIVSNGKILQTCSIILPRKKKLSYIVVNKE